MIDADVVSERPVGVVLPGPDVMHVYDAGTHGNDASARARRDIVSMQAAAPMRECSVRSLCDDQGSPTHGRQLVAANRPARSNDKRHRTAHAAVAVADNYKIF